jgi:hypothetical protein
MVPEMIPPISIDELREAWPAYLARTERTNVQKAQIPLPLPVSIRCHIMADVSQKWRRTDGTTACHLAQMPLDGSRIKEEMQKPLTL